MRRIHDWQLALDIQSVKRLGLTQALMYLPLQTPTNIDGVILKAVCILCQSYVVTGAVGDRITHSSAALRA